MQGEPFRPSVEEVVILGVIATVIAVITLAGFGIVRWWWGRRYWRGRRRRTRHSARGPSVTPRS